MMSRTILIWVLLSRLLPEGPPNRTHCRGSAEGARQEWEVTSHRDERIDTVQEVADFTLNRRARVGHWMEDSWSPPTSWLVRSSPRLQSPQLGSSDGEHPSSSLRSAQSSLPSQREPRDTQPPPYWHWKAEAPQPQANWD